MGIDTLALCCYFQVGFLEIFVSYIINLKISFSNSTLINMHQ